MPYFRTQSRYIAALIPFVCEEETRYCLNGINVKPLPSGGIVLAATDGHTIGTIFDPDGVADEEMTIPIDRNGFVADLLMRLFQLETVADHFEGTLTTSRFAEGGAFVAENGTATIHAKDGKSIHGIFSSTPIDGTFPYYPELFTNHDFGAAHDCFAFNGNLLGKFSVCAEILCESVVPHLMVRFSAKPKDAARGFDSAQLVTFRFKNFAGLIMPVGAIHEFPEAKVPDWLRALPPNPNPNPGKKAA
jgi:hypothetical protein